VYWILAILFINPAIAITAYGVIRVTGITLPTLAPWNLTVVPLLIVFFIAALGEELGWTGYITEPLIERWGIISASLLLGIIWAAIHFIALNQEHRSLEWITWWSLGTISYRMIMTWLYVHDGTSLFGAALFHAMINFCWQMFPNNGSHYDPRLFGLIAFLIVIALFAGERLLRRQFRIFKPGVSNEKIF
jgi:membrane protease YdiL (CAAX protease family)